jgi:putative peptidoglycan binding protein
MRYEFSIQPETFEFQAEVDETASVPGLADFHAPPPLDAARATSRRHPAYVAWVQGSLNLIHGSRTKVDGVLGPRTRALVRAFQQQRGLRPDGVVGPRTEAALRYAGAPPLPWERRGVMRANTASQWQSELSQRPGCTGLSGFKDSITYYELWLDNCMVQALQGGMGITAAIAGLCGAIRIIPCAALAASLTVSLGIIVVVNNWGGSRGVKIFFAVAPPAPVPVPLAVVPFAIFPQ